MTLTEPSFANPSSQPAPERERLGEMLVKAGKLSARDLERALSAQQELGNLLGQVLIQLGVVSELDVAHTLARQLNIPFIAADAFPAESPEVPGLLPEFLHSNAVYPLSVADGELAVAMARPQDAFVLKALRLSTGLTIRPHLALEADIEKALSEPVSEEVDEGSDDFDAGSDAGDFVEHLKDLASEAPVIRLVNAIVSRVIDMRASDIHLEPFDDGLHVRYRVDGVIHNADVVPPRLSAAVNSRVKLLAHLDIAERRLPQDGRIKMRVKGRELDLRVSTVPTVHGESVVMRVLDRASVRLNLDKMGFEADTLERFNALLAKPHGILLVTGPTGTNVNDVAVALRRRVRAQEHRLRPLPGAGRQPRVAHHLVPPHHGGLPRRCAAPDGTEPAPRWLAVEMEHLDQRRTHAVVAHELAAIIGVLWRDVIGQHVPTGRGCGTPFQCDTTGL